MEQHLSRLTEIPIRVEHPARAESSAMPAHESARSAPGGMGGGVAAVLCELVSLLERLAHGAPSTAIDLRSLPMSPQDRSELQRALGEGEVQATVNAEGLSHIRETQFSGIWWIEHRDRTGELIAELIEVTHVPQILASASDEIAAGAQALRARIVTVVTTPPRVEN
jgi:hydrogenase-1 operon protein HyaF